MSRCYDMGVRVSGFDKKKVAEIENAAEEEWGFEDWFDYKGELDANGEGNLCGGEGEDEFSRRLALAIWKANGKYCKVEVCATLLEDLPHETYAFDEDDYKRMADAVEAEA